MKRLTQPDIDRAYSLYAGICNRWWGDDAEGVQTRVAVIEELEGMTRKEFRTTPEFHHYVGELLNTRSATLTSTGKRIQRKRRDAGVTQQELADTFGVTRRTLVRYENDTLAPSQKALEWLGIEAGDNTENVT